MPMNFLVHSYIFRFHRIRRQDSWGDFICPVFGELLLLFHFLLLCVDSYTHNIEAVSCDEALVDITEIIAETRLTAEELASVIRSEIKAKTKCPASIGIG